MIFVAFRLLTTTDTLMIYYTNNFIDHHKLVYGSSFDELADYLDLFSRPFDPQTSCLLSPRFRW